MKSLITIATCSALLGVGLASPLRAQTVHYDAGFEAPTFQLGNLAGTTLTNGQDGWLATGDQTTDPNLNQIVVQAALAKTGARAVEIDATGQPSPFAHIRRNSLFTISPTEPLLDITFDMRISQAATTPSEWGIQAQSGPGPGSGILEWWIDVAGELHMTSATGPVATGVVINRDQWYRVVTRLDYNAQTYSVSFDGQIAATVAGLSGETHWYHAFTSLMFIQPGDDRMYVDNFSLVTHDGAVASTYCTAGTTSHGCAPAISATGVPSASATSGFTIAVANVEGQKQGLILYGVMGRVASPWGNGGASYLCVKAPLQRTGVQNSGGTLNFCDGSLALDWSAFRAAHPTALGSPFAAGQVIDAQGWFRDPPAVKTSNLSNGVEFTLQP